MSDEASFSSLGSQDQNPQVAFARAPGQAGSGQILDYTKEPAKKLYKNATAPLASLHDLKASNLRDFLQLLSQRVDVYDWDTIVDIENDDGTFVNLIKQYGNVSLEQVRNEASVYEGKNNRASQDSQMMADCILNSLTSEARNTITLYANEYNVNGVRSGPCMLKVVIRESHIDTNATTRILREELNKLDTYMVSIDSDIVKFNEHVKDLLEQLHARGQMTHDLLSNLFKAYKAASDKDFVSYINKKKDEYDEGQEIQPSKLMLLAQNKYNTKKQDGEWNAPSTEQEELIALRAELKKLKVTKANKHEVPPKDNTSDKQRSRKPRKPSWMYIPPSQGEKHTKTVNKKEWHWCPKHECWVRHSPDKCKGKGFVPGKRKKPDGFEKNQAKESDEQSEQQQQPSKKVKMANALMALLQRDD
jgi:hypothetical protein